MDTPPLDLPGGGAIFVSGINASDGAVQFQVTGIDNPAKLSIDVTRKPLIQLVWFGLYIVLGGGAVATVFRARQVRRSKRYWQGWRRSASRSGPHRQPVRQRSRQPRLADAPLGFRDRVVDAVPADERRSLS